MEQYSVKGMSCAACSARVEKAVAKVPGVESVSVSLLTNSMGVEGTASEQAVIEAVQKAGYQAAHKGEEAGKAAQDRAEEELEDHATPALRRRLIVSLLFLCPLLYLSMGHMMWNWPLPGVIADNHVAMGLAQMLLTIAIMVVNQRFFTSGVTSFLHRAPNMDTLVALGSGAAFVYSTYALFAMTAAQTAGDQDSVMKYMHEFYFESAAMILTLITLGKMLEAYSKGKTTTALKSLMHLAPKMATVIRDGKEETILAKQVRVADCFVVRPGESIPVDGKVLEGHSAVEEAALTGESIPVDKKPGDMVSAATINQSGFLKCEATRVGEDTTLSQIIRMVSDAAATKAPIAKVADRVSGVFVPAVILIALVTIVVWLAVGQSVGFALARGISVLVISCPCALGLATPVAIMVGNGVGARNGILFKTAVSLEETGKIAIAALDKTGTITSGQPEVTDVYPVSASAEKLLQAAYALEQKSEHPLAKAIVAYAREQKVTALTLDDFQAVPGKGLCGSCSGQMYYGGNRQYMQEQISISQTVQEHAKKLAKQGKTPLFFATEKELLGIIAVADVIKEDSCKAVQQLKNLGIYVVMLTGDNADTANAIAKQAGVDEVVAGVLPQGKEEVVRKLQQQGKVAMVGDGINDAPALTRADIGIAIGAGTDVALDAADVVLMKSSLLDVAAAVRLSRKVLKNIHENLFWAFFYNTIGIPLAAGALYAAFAVKLNPMFAAAAMSLSSFCVVSNALRLNLVNIKNAAKDHCRSRKKQPVISTGYAKNQEKEEGENMERTLKIKGMMCAHCEGRVKDALEAIEGVTGVVVSHTQETAVVTLQKEVPDEVLKKAVVEQGYKVISVK